LLPIMGPQLQQLRNQEYELRKQALDNLIGQKLLELEAKKKAITAELLIQQEVDSKIAEPGEAEVQAYYLGQKDKFNRPFDEIKAQLSQGLKQERIQSARQDYVRRLRDKADVAILLEPPRVAIDYNPGRVRGNPNAPVTIVEFSDFQCPFCGQAYPVIKEILSKYEGRVRLAYRDFPLRQIHPQAQTAAEAARCAMEQGKFWEYHDLLFQNQNKLDKAGLVELASSVKVDRTKFESCLDSGKFRSEIDKDLQAGNRAGVNGTPAFFINGILVTGAQPASVFEKIIDAELKSETSKQAKP
jgi:protein-disulfide isomerase